MIIPGKIVPYMKLQRVSFNLTYIPMLAFPLSQCKVCADVAKEVFVIDLAGGSLETKIGLEYGTQSR